MIWKVQLFMAEILAPSKTAWAVELDVRLLETMFTIDGVG